MSDKFMLFCLLLIFGLVGLAIYSGSKRHECDCYASMWDRDSKKCLMSRPQPYCTIWKR